MNPPGEAPAFLDRFTRAERTVHRLTAGLLLICLFTASALYMGPVSTIVGHRRLVELVHVYCGLALPGPLVAGLASAAYRAGYVGAARGRAANSSASSTPARS